MEEVITRRLKIVNDDDSESPRQWDNLGTIAFKHSKYILGEEKIENDPIWWLESMLEIEHKDIYTSRRFSELNDRFCTEFIALPLYIYDHSGITISTRSFSCRWDSGQFGWIYVSKERAKEEYDWKIITAKRREFVEKQLIAEIKTFDDYLTGNVYGFEIIDDEEDIIVASCYGFIGDDYAEAIAEHISPEMLNLSTNEEVIKLITNTEVSYD